MVIVIIQTFMDFDPPPATSFDPYCQTLDSHPVGTMEPPAIHRTDDFEDDFEILASAGGISARPHGVLEDSYGFCHRITRVGSVR